MIGISGWLRFGAAAIALAAASYGAVPVRAADIIADWPTIGAYSSIFAIAFRKYQNTFAQPFERVTVWVKPRHVGGEFRFAKGREPA